MNKEKLETAIALIREFLDENISELERGHNLMLVVRARNNISECLINIENEQYRIK